MWWRGRTTLWRNHPSGKVRIANVVEGQNHPVAQPSIRKSQNCECGGGAEPPCGGNYPTGKDKIADAVEDMLVRAVQLANRERQNCRSGGV